jgi:hypothetical protein
MSPKTVHWHSSVKDNEHDSDSTSVGHKATLHAQVQQGSSFFGLDSKKSGVSSKPQPEWTSSQPVLTKVFRKSNGYPDVSYPSLVETKTAYRGQSGSSASKTAAPKVASKPKRVRSSLPVMNTGASYDQVLYPASSPSKTSSPSKRSSKTSSPRKQKSEVSVLPWVPDAPNLLEVPNTPRPRRLPTPDLPPIDPWTFYPHPIKPYNDGAIAPGTAKMREDIKRETSPLPRGRM